MHTAGLSSPPRQLRPVRGVPWRSRMARLALAALVCVVGFVGSGPAAAAPARAGGSWVDTLHGWALSSDGITCAPRADLCATNDGGATWQGIFNGAVDQFVRTSVRA